jgi:hypothetical protein
MLLKALYFIFHGPAAAFYLNIFHKINQNALIMLISIYDLSVYGK